MTYEMDIAGLKRELPLCKLNENLCIGAFVMFGDVELTVHCAAELLKRAPEYDYIIAPEAKAIPLGYEMARQSAAERYFVARKGAKAYMQGTFEVTVKSITTMGVQRLVIDAEDAAFIKGKRMLIVDDVISTGESLHAVEELVTKAGGIVAGGGDDSALNDDIAARDAVSRAYACAETGIAHRKRAAAERRVAGDVDGLADRERIARGNVDAGGIVEALDGVLAVNTNLRITETREPRPWAAGVVPTVDGHVTQSHIRTIGDGQLDVCAKRTGDDVAVVEGRVAGHFREVDRRRKCTGH